MNRIRVSQTDARALANGIRGPLAVGIVRRTEGDTSRPRPLGVAIKLTVRFDGADGPHVADPEPLRADGDPMVVHASDFNLPLANAHVLVEGHAHSDRPTEAIEAALVVGPLAFPFSARSETPMRSIPLEPKFLPLPGAAIESDAALELVGLSPRAARREIRLPGIYPRAWLDQTAGRMELTLVCDTLHLDTDFERVRCVWRGMLPDDLTDFDVDGLVVSLERHDAARAEEEVLRFLPRGTFSFAQEEGPAPDGDPDELEMARYEALEHAADPEMPLERFAAISARLAEQDRPRKDVIADYDLDERTWAIEERAWVQRMGDRSMAGDGTSSAEFGERFVAEQDALAGPNEPRRFEEYAALKAALDDSDQPAQTLKARGVSFGEWCRLDRHWGKRA